MKKYFFVDPINSPNSGITKYVQYAEEILCKDFDIYIISINGNETIENFSKRLKKELDSHDFNTIACIEFPETYTTSRYIDEKYPIHIRLHGSRTIGKFIQGLSIEQSILLDEQKEINKALWVSSPSKINLFVTKAFNTLPKDVSIMPNPVSFEGSKSVINYKPTFHEKGFFKDKKVIVFLGRWQKLKGIYYFEYLAEKFKNNKDIVFVALVPDVPNVKNDNIFFKKIIDDETKFYYLSKSYLCIIPSYYESFSMVAIESVACGTKVLTWKHIGATEYIDKKYIYTVESFSKHDLKHKFESIIFDKKYHADIVSKNSLSININNMYSSHIKDMIVGKNISTDRFLLDYFYYILTTYPLLFKHRKSILMKKKIDNYRNVIYLKLDQEITNGNSRKMLKYSRKAIKDPYHFLRDFKFIKKNVFLTSAVDKYFLSDMSNTANTSSDNKKKSTEISSNNLISNKGLTLNKGFFFYIKKNEEITFKKVNIPKNSNLIVFSNSSIDEIYRLESVYKKNKEKLFMSSNNFIGKFEVNHDSHLPRFNLFDKVNYGNLSYLNEFRNIILFNPTDHIVDLFTYSLYEKNIIIVYTSGSEVNEVSRSSTNIVTYSNMKFKKYDYQTIYLYEDLLGMKSSIDKFIKDNVHRDLDFLLPILGYHDSQSEIFKDFNNTDYDGFIMLKDKNIDLKSNNFHDMCLDLFSDIVSLGLLESIYNKYPKVVSDIYKNINVEDNLMFLLKKGVRFNVIH